MWVWLFLALYRILFVQPILNKIILTTSRFRLITKHRLVITLGTPTQMSLGPMKIKLTWQAMVIFWMMVPSCVLMAPNHGRQAGATPNVPSSLSPWVVVLMEIYKALPTLAMLHLQLCSSRSTTGMQQSQTQTPLTHSTAQLESIHAQEAGNQVTVTQQAGGGTSFTDSESM